MNHRARMIATWVAFGAAACGEASRYESDTTRGAIVNGAADDTRDAVVALAVGGGLCSGTIIHTDPAERLGVVLTAAHCLDGNVAWRVFQGADFLDPDATFYVFGSASEDRFVIPEYDVALVRFVGADETTPTMDLLLPEDGVPTTGDDVIAVGYGKTLPGFTVDRNSIRHFIDMTIVGDTETVMTISGFGNSCPGDSGGPILKDVGGVEKVVGVTSQGDDSCYLGSVAARVGPSVDFVHSFIAEPVGESCERCYRTLLSNGGECVDPMQRCEDDEICAALWECFDACHDDDCVRRCAMSHEPGIDGFVRYGDCTCDRCDLCEGNGFCSGIDTLRAYRDAPPEEAPPDAGASADGGVGVPAPSGSFSGGGCSCRVGEPAGETAPLGALLVGLSILSRRRARRRP